MGRAHGAAASVSAVGTLEGLRRRERAIAAVRWLATAFLVVEVVRLDVGPGERVWGWVLVGAVALLGGAVALSLRATRTASALHRIGLLVFVVDVLLVASFALLARAAPMAEGWAVAAILPLEGAVRAGFAGAIGGWLVAAPVAAVGTGGSLGAWGSRAAIYLLVALLGGLTARELETQRRLLQRLASGAQELVASRDEMRILSALCQRAAGLLEGRTAAVLRREAGSLVPVACWPEDATPVWAGDDLLGGDIGEALHRGSRWAPPLAAVPLRWRERGEPAVLAVRRAQGRPAPLEEQALSALADSAVVALATADLLRAQERATARLRRLERLRTRFVATVAHDLRSPLTTVKGVAAMLRTHRDDVPAEKVDALLDSVERQANRLNRLADDLLDAARVERELLDLRRAPCDLRDLVATAVRDLTEEDVRVELEGDLGLVADGARLERVIWNLLSNAEKHGRAPLEVRAWREDGAVVLTVRDHGGGIPQEQRARLFEDFAAGAESASVGLGLAIVWDLVTAHGGDVRYLDADPGACFEIRLPGGTAVDVAAPVPAAS